MPHFLFQCLIVLALLGYCVFLFRERFSLKALYSCALTILAGGTAIYMWGFSVEPVHQGGVTLFVRSLLASSEMFVLHNDLLEIEAVQEESHVFLDLFYLCYIAAILTTVTTVISIFSKRVLTAVLLHFNKDLDIRYVFMGFSHKGVTLARTLSGGRIAFIEFPKEKEKEAKGLGRFFADTEAIAKIKDRLDSRAITTLRARRRIHDLAEGEDVLKGIGLAGLKKHLRPDTEFYILTKYVDNNLKDLITMRKDPFFDGHMIHVYTKKTPMVTLYEDCHPEFETDFIHTSNLCVRQIAMHDALMPGENGCALILGFGETGQAIAQYLYCQFESLKFVAFDKAMDTSAGVFFASHPGTFKSGRCTFEQMQLGTASFWTKLESYIGGIDYIVTATDDNEMNVSITGSLLKVCNATRKGGTRDLKVLIRQDIRNDSLEGIVENLRMRFPDASIHVFGEDEQLFTGDYIM